jgi:16S rRNA (guanine(1405)-N(7))-methyltransferase
VPDVDEVVSMVLAARRYRHLDPHFVTRIARDVCRHARRAMDAADETKRRLHQVYGAYVQDLPVERFAAELEATVGDPAAQREAALRLMRAHASTRERLNVLDTFYAEVFALTGPPRRVLDLACGFGPLALPWMRLPPGATYHAFDVDARYVTLAKTCLRVFGVEGSAALRDVAAEPPGAEADVALLLKSVPCLEQQSAGSAARVLDALHARHIVISFPTRSLGGAGKGMITTYRGVMERLMAGGKWSARELLFPLELVFVVDTRGD